LKGKRRPSQTFKQKKANHFCVSGALPKPLKYSIENPLKTLNFLSPNMKSKVAKTGLTIGICLFGKNLSGLKLGILNLFKQIQVIKQFL